MVNGGGRTVLASSSATISSIAWSASPTRPTPGSPAASSAFLRRAGRQTSLADPTGTTTWSDDAGGRVTAVAGPQGSLGYGYDQVGRRTSLTLPGN